MKPCDEHANYIIAQKWKKFNFISGEIPYRWNTPSKQIWSFQSLSNNVRSWDGWWDHWSQSWRLQNSQWSWKADGSDGSDGSDGFTCPPANENKFTAKFKVWWGQSLYEVASYSPLIFKIQSEKTPKRHRKDIEKTSKVDVFSMPFQNLLDWILKMMGV